MRSARRAAQADLGDDPVLLFNLTAAALEEGSISAQLRKAVTEALVVVARSLRLVGELEEEEEEKRT